MDRDRQTLLGKVRHHGAIVFSVATLIALSVHPAPWCIDCEFPNPWGHISDSLDDILAAWLLVAPFAAGLLAFKNSWLVPLGMVLATFITQPLAGVAWWSLRANEGPLILIIGLPLCGACWVLGLCVRAAILSTKRNLQPGTQI